MRILLVEDHTGLGHTLRKSLHGEGYSVDWVQSIAEAEAAIGSATYSLMLLDLGLPDGNGLDFLTALRRARQTIPVLVLTARSGLNDRVDGLDGGADDYLVKPFAIRELHSRCRVLLRRPRELIASTDTIGNVTINHQTAEVRINSKIVPMPRRELQLLKALTRRGEMVSTRDYLNNELYDYDTEAGQNALEASISRLRSLLDQNAASVEIITLRGIGYSLHPKRATEDE